MSIVCFTTELFPSCWALYAKTSSYVCSNVLRRFCCSRVKSALCRLNAERGSVSVAIGTSRVISASMSDLNNSKVAMSAVSGNNWPNRVRR